MGHPRFLADHDLNEDIVDGLLRRQPDAEFLRARHLGIDRVPDIEVLEYAAINRLLVVSHDVNTMPAAFYRRQLGRLPVPGLLMVQQSTAVRTVIDSLLLIWSASEHDEWIGVVAFLPL